MCVRFYMETRPGYSETQGSVGFSSKFEARDIAEHGMYEGEVEGIGIK